MKIDQNVNLAEHSTMRLGGKAAYLCSATNRNEISEALTWAKSNKLPAIIIGQGSNIVWRDEGFPGLIIVNDILKYEQYDEDETNTYLTVGAGEIWDGVVERSVNAGLTGIEALSLIPGKAGATPVQNVGAYGQDISQTLTTVEAYDTQAQKIIMMPAIDCEFGYRTSRFKTTDHGRFFITALTLHLRRGNPMPPFYSSVEDYFQANNIKEHTPLALRQAVMSIRLSKLPDPAIVSNTGSFFANPIISEESFISLSTFHENLPHWKDENGIKLSAAWLIEQAGFKDSHDAETGMGTWPSQPLVVVNENAGNTADLLAYKQKIVDKVKSKFGITLIQEPELLP